VGSLVLTSSVITIVGTLPHLNLTTIAGTDWAHWGDGSVSSLTPQNTMSGGPGAISATGDLAGADGNDFRFTSWTNGTPTASATNTRFRIFSSAGVGKQFVVSFPATTTIYSATVHCATRQASATVTFHLSDSSASDVVVTIPDGGSSSSVADFEVYYAANSGGQTLTVTIQTATSSSPGNDQLSLSSATLSESPSNSRDAQNVIEVAFPQATVNARDAQNVLEVAFPQIGVNARDAQNVLEVAFPQIGGKARDAQNVLEVYIVKNQLPYSYIDLVAD